jgi:hypothetical protein
MPSRGKEEGITAEPAAEEPWESPGRSRLDWEPHRGALLCGLGIAAVVAGHLAGLAASFDFLPGYAALPAAALGLTVAVLARRDLEQIRRGGMDPAETDKTKLAGSLGLLAILLGLLPAAIRAP